MRGGGQGDIEGVEDMGAGVVNGEQLWKRGGGVKGEQGW